MQSILRSSLVNICYFYDDITPGNFYKNKISKDFSFFAELICDLHLINSVGNCCFYGVINLNNLVPPVNSLSTARPLYICGVFHEKIIVTMSQLGPELTM